MFKIKYIIKRKFGQIFVKKAKMHHTLKGHLAMIIELLYFIIGIIITSLKLLEKRDLVHFLVKYCL